MSRPRPGRSGRPGASALASSSGPVLVPHAMRRQRTSAPHRTGLYRAFSGGCEDPDLRGHRPQLGASKGRDMRRREAWLGPGPPAFSRAARVDATTPPWVPSAWSPRGRVVPPATLLGPAPAAGPPTRRPVRERSASRPRYFDRGHTLHPLHLVGRPKAGPGASRTRRRPPLDGR